MVEDNILKNHDQLRLKNIKYSMFRKLYQFTSNDGKADMSVTGGASPGQENGPCANYLVSES